MSDHRTAGNPRGVPLRRAERTLPAAPGAEHMVVACTPQSGSNLLCDVLRTNELGEPKEWFQVASSMGSDRQDIGLEALLLKRQTEEFLAAHASARWRSVKFDWQQFHRLRTLATNLPGTEPVLQNLLRGHWIFLRRRDLASQAVSLYADQVSGAWMGDGAADYDSVPEDFDAIYERFAALAADTFAWEEFFRAGKVTPVRVYYEDMLGGNPVAWENLLRRLAPNFDSGQLDLSALQVPPHEHKQIHTLKTWFHELLVAGRRPRSLLALLEEIGRTVARVERAPSVDGLLGRFAGDLIPSQGGFRLTKLDLSRDLQRNGPVTLVKQGHFLDGAALRLDSDTACSFAVPATRVMLQFYAHAWSGIAEIRIGDRKEELDLFSERPGTRNFIRNLPPGFSGPIEVRSSKTKHLLSQGFEVWLQRVLVLSNGGEAT